MLMKAVCHAAMKWILPLVMRSGVLTAVRQMLLLPTDTYCQSFCKTIVKGPIKLCRCKCWSGPSLFTYALWVERCGAVVKHRTRDREVPGSIPTNSKCCFLEQETLSTLLSTGFYPGKKRATWKISTRLLNVLPSINKVDYYYYYYKCLS